MSPSPLPNYLRTQRQRHALSQEEVGFLLGFHGPSRGSKVSRDEHFVREPSLQTALAYEVIYQKPVRELFAGLYHSVERDVTARAKVLTYRVEQKPNPPRRKMLASLALRQSKRSLHPAQS